MDYLIGAVASVIIVIVVVAYLIVRMALKHEEKRLAMKNGGERTEKILAETQAELAGVRERLKVLERLATDEDRRVAQEINKLAGAETLRESNRS